MLPGTPLEQGLNTLSDLDNGLTKGIKPIIQTWLENYKGPDSQYIESYLEVGNTTDGGLDNTAWGVLNDANLQ